MDWRAEIRAALRDTVREMLLDGAVQATVVSVDKDAATIVAHGLKEDVDYFDVRLRAVLDDNNGRGVLAYPVEGSQVVIGWLDGIDTMGYVSQLSDIESFRLVVDNGVSLDLTATGQLLLNGDALGGLVQVGPLVKRINKLEERMNSHQHLVGKAPTLPDLASNPLIVATKVTDLENPNVKHG
jgi:hypothetical protein